MKETLAGKRVMVTGGAGFIGSHLCDQILRLDPESLSIADDFSLGKERNIESIMGDKRVSVRHVDLTDFSMAEEVLKS
ncbi:MAG TPA: GDP-mannose 4,6-dehydratase, partial [Nitrososphaerales archaeon]|nr:GDP-mannose 4,6-dehydratase [Nitrososphaerales archaeon]